MNKEDEKLNSIKFRTEYKKIAEENTIISQQLLEEFYVVGWKLAIISSSVIDDCLSTSEVVVDVKKTLLLLMLRNCISDICCCLDSLERGHERTVLNNLRMVFEDFCCVIHIHNDDVIYQKFINGQHQASKSIGTAKKLRVGDKKFDFLYGELSKVFHHVRPELIARQMQTRDGQLSHLKLINEKCLDVPKTPLYIIIDFLRSIGEFAEEICLNFLPSPYFWIKSSTRNLETSIDILIQKLVVKVESQ